jgi:hypothetical protein
VDNSPLSASSTPLSRAEEELLHQLEHVVETGLAGFLEVGRALLEIKEDKLYRVTHESFETYCKERWHFSAHHGARILRSIAVVQNLENGDCPPLPPDVSEALMRPLAPLEAPLQQAVW